MGSWLGARSIVAKRVRELEQEAVHGHSKPTEKEQRAWSGGDELVSPLYLPRDASMEWHIHT